MATRLEKVSFHSNPKEGQCQRMFKLRTTALISYASKILQARLQQYVNRELPDAQAGFRKGGGTRDQIANICRITEKARELRKTSTSALLIMPKPLTVWIITEETEENSQKDGNTRPPYLLLRNQYAGQEAIVRT